MIRNIIFDMGNVLIHFDPDVLIARLGITGADAETLKANVFEAPGWAGLDNGSLTEPGLVEILKKKLPKHLHAPMAELVLHWDRPLLEVPGMCELVKSMKEQGYHIYLLSNASVRQHEYWPRIAASEYFDGGVVSADVKQVKPGRDIYQTLFQKYDLEPEECFFIDDSAANIETAVSLGMQGFVFRDDVEVLRAVLAELG